MVLSSYDIMRYVELSGLIDPFSKEQINPASYDLTLNDTLVQDVEGSNEMFTITDDVDVFIDPGEFMLASTVEEVDIPLNLVGIVNGKSSLGRKGLAIHVTAGYIDPGFHGQITLELANLSKYPILLKPGMRIAQLILMNMSSPPLQDYSETGRYQDQYGPTLSRYEYEG